MRRVWRYFRARRFDTQLRAEIEAHLDEKIEAFVAAGLSPAEARTRALLEFGNRTLITEDSRGQWAFAWLDQFAQDLRYALRVLRKSPVFTLVAVASLALGIGANTAIFSAIDGVLLQALPYPDSNRLFVLWGTQSKGTEHSHVSAADFYDLRSQSHAFESLSAFSSWPMNLTNIEEPRRVQTELVSANLFSLLQVQPKLGRTFFPDEDREQSAPVVVLSDRLWRELNQPVVGSRLTLNSSDATIVGVMPPSFAFPSREVDAWVPLSLNAANRANREGRWLQVVGRLNATTNPERAQTELDLICGRIGAAYPATNKGWSISLVSLKDEIVGKTAVVLWTLQAGTLLLLLATCTNLANLLLARGASRSREIGLRAALGASRGRIARQFMVESGVLAMLGGFLGLALSAAGIKVFQTFAEPLLPRAAEISLNVPSVLVALAATLLITLLFGLAPILAASRVDLKDQIASEGRASSRHADAKRGLLVIVEVAMATVLLVVAGLLGGSLTLLLRTSTGFRIDHLLTLRLTLSHSQYPSNDAQNALFDRILDRVQAIPGVAAAAEISETPLGGNNPTFEYALEAAPSAPANVPIRAGYRAVSPNYLATAGIPILEGRELLPTDTATGLPVAIINSTMARRCWPNVSPLGRRLRLKDESRWITVAGVIPDVKHLGLREEEGPVLYIPYSQKTQDWLSWTTLVVRTRTAPLSFAPAVRRAIYEVDKNQPIAEVGTLEELLSRSTAIPRFTTITMALISVFSLLVALIGVYGLLTYSIAQRIPELGIRLTLGASPFQVSWLLLRQSVARVALGIALGLLLAWWIARFIESQLFHFRPHDPGVFAAVAVLLLLASMVAVLSPARRASRIDPAAALRKA